MQRVGTFASAAEAIEARDLTILLAGLPKTLLELPEEMYVDATTGKLQDNVVVPAAVADLLETSCSSAMLDSDGLSNALSSMSSLIPAQFWLESETSLAAS